MSEIVHVRLSRIHGNPWQSRPLDPDYVSELASDILQNGLLQPPVGRILVDGVERDLQFGNAAAVLRDDPAALVQLVAGHHRLAAIRQLAKTPQANGRPWQTIPVQLGTYTDEQMAVLAWSENYQRKNLTAIEEARAIQQVMDDFGWNQVRVGERFGLNRSTVAHKLSLLKLPEPIQHANAEGLVSERQALALIGVGNLVEKLDGREDVQWSQKDDPRQASYYDPPLSPEKYIAFVASHSDEVTSDDIRQYTKDLLKHAGTKIPGKIPVTELDGENVVQATCRRCPRRSNDYCLEAACLETKKALYGCQVAQEAAAELEIPYSADEAHFEPWKAYDKIEQLKAAYHAGTCDHLVAGFADHDWAVRPFSDGRWVDDDDAYSSWAGVILGCTHETIGDCAAPSPEEDAGPVDELAERAEAWAAAAQKQRTDLVKRTKQALREQLREGLNDDAILASLLELLTNKGVYDGRDVDALCKGLIDYAWERGKFISYEHETAFRLYPRALQILAIAGLDPEAVLEAGYGPNEQFLRECQRLLGQWADWRDYHWSLDTHARQIAKPLQALLERDAAGWLQSDELAQAAADLEAVRGEVLAILDEAEEPDDVDTGNGAGDIDESVPMDASEEVMTV